MTRILLIGNYAPERQHSMLRYSAWLADQLVAGGFDVDHLQPPVRFNRLTTGGPRLRKWLGLVDKFILFPLTLLRTARNYDRVHICDHSNAPYRMFLRDRPVSITCHDLITIKTLQGEFDGQRLDLTARVLQRWILASLKRIPAVIGVSQTTIDDFFRIVGRPSRLPALIPNPVFGFRPLQPAAADDELRQSGIEPHVPFFLHVGSNLWYKNRIGAIELFGRLRQYPRFRTFKMVCAGPELSSEQIATCRAQGLLSHLIVVRDPTHGALNALYSRAQALLFISRYEGFGWPIVEAQACGCPVVTTDQDPMRTIAGPPSLLVDPDRLDDAAATVNDRWSWFSDQRENSIANIARFSEQLIARQYIDFFRSTVTA